MNEETIERTIINGFLNIIYQEKMKNEKLNNSIKEFILLNKQCSDQLKKQGILNQNEYDLLKDRLSNCEEQITTLRGKIKIAESKLNTTISEREEIRKDYNTVLDISKTLNKEKINLNTLLTNCETLQKENETLILTLNSQLDDCNKSKTKIEEKKQQKIDEINELFLFEQLTSALNYGINAENVLAQL